MVAISRQIPRRRRVGGKSSPTVFTFRNFLILLAMVQGSRMMLMKKTDAPPNAMPASPKAWKDQLEDSKVNSRKKSIRGRDHSQGSDKENGDKKSPVSEEEGMKPMDSLTTNDSVEGQGHKTDASGENNSIGQSGNKAGQEMSPPADLNPIVLDKKGTGPTNVGYVKDFFDERLHPAYRSIQASVTDHSPTVAKLINEKSVLPCHDEMSGSTNQRCLDPDTPLIAYNSESFHRTWCGQEIKPKSAVVMAEHCTDPIAHLFPSDIPPITGEHMPPIVIKSSVDKEVADGDLEKVDCDIPCQQEKGLNLDADKNNKRDFFIDGEAWKITSAWDSGNNPKLDRTDYMNGHYYSSQSLLSSVPLSTFDFKFHSIRNRPALEFDTAAEKAIYLVDKKCAASTKRNRWFEGVAEELTVDSYGSCGHNIEVPDGMTISTPEGRIALSKQYRIVLAFDELTSKDHISDVVWEAFLSGAVPVVVGAENIRERFPANSFINVKDFNRYGELGEYVKKVASDKDLWMSYHKWRDDEKAIAAFERQYEFTRTGPTCRLCRWAYAKKYGLGWDHVKQEVRSIPKVPKEKFCSTADHGLVSKPFLEQWVTKRDGEDSENVLEEDSDGESCSSVETDGDIVVGSFKSHRRVVQHDGVTDFIITEASDEIPDAETILRLNFPNVRNPDGACFYNTHSLISTAKGPAVSSASIQDDLVKITVLANWDTAIRSSSEGTMEVVIIKNNALKTDKDSSTPRRVRVIIEEMNKVHDKMTEFYPSSYCKLMTKDFLDPINVFFADSS